MSYFVLAQEAAPSWGALLWTFLNSQVGIFLLSSVLAFVITWLVKKQPKAVEIFLQNKALFVTAVRKAEEAIPDGSPNAALAKFDTALKFMLTYVESGALKAKEADIRKALELAHAAEQKKVEGGSEGAV